ncbi:hypothetical protein Hanom_Chr07g00650301 [Helianthus anomalus]
MLLKLCFSLLVCQWKLLPETEVFVVLFFPCLQEEIMPPIVVDDANEGVTRLSAHALTQDFPFDWKGYCSIVYQRRRRDPCLAPPTETPMVPVDDNEWIVDPHPLEWYGEALYTSVEVLSMFPRA